MKTLHKLFEDGIKDMYNAEKQLIKALPKMAKMAKNSKLKEGFQHHLHETEAHAKRIEMACEHLGTKPTGMVCRAMKGLVEEASEHMAGLKPSACTDAELIALAQKVEHYEIGSYGTLCRWAQTMGHTEVLDLLKKNLGDEERTDQLLTQIAEGEVNQMAQHESNGMNEKKVSGKKRRTASSGATTRSRTTSRGSATGRTSTRVTGRAKAAATSRSSGRVPARSGGRSTASSASPGRSSKSGGRSMR